jgi:gamma-glutamyltranspeptidase / glutathione hydrolase
MLLPGGKAPKPGQIFRNPYLAQTLRDLATKGTDGFYKGRVAEAIVDGLSFLPLRLQSYSCSTQTFNSPVVQSQGGVLTLEDLAAHKSTLVEPISYTYRSSVTLHETPPNGQGLTALIALGILDELQELGTVDLNKVEYGSADWFHILIEATRLAFADTRAYVADPEKAKVPVKELLNKVPFPLLLLLHSG